ncbi:hypothetical protein [Listeria innocua]|uniref:hypothetical protein n=1 Tax=Listeria innocua TaxID=1642 RepID=UPI0016268706|nr:hypothetical protein [Listeria innocua]MBC2238732.1 hypothetical protein [Listeria innocua]
MKKQVIISLVICLLFLLVGSLLWIYNVNNKIKEEPVVTENAYNKVKKEPIVIKKAHDFLQYSLEEEGYFYSFVNNQDVLYALIDEKEELLSTDVFALDKNNRLKSSIYKTKNGEDGEISVLGGNEDYLVWLDGSYTSHLYTMVVYNIAQKRVVTTIESTDENYFDTFILQGDTIYWIEEDTTKKTEEEITGEDKDTMIIGNHMGEIKSYNIVSRNYQTIDMIKTVNHPNEVLTVSEDKLWYIDNREFEETALIKTYDFTTKEIAAYDLKEQFLGHLKPVNNHSVAFFKYSIHEGPKGLYLYNTNSRKITVINAQETDYFAIYNGKGKIISTEMTYEINQEEEIKFSDTLQQAFYKDFYLSSVGPFASLSFTTSIGVEFDSIVEFNENSLKWRGEL